MSAYTLIAEITHRCPLHCAYCSNPTALTPSSMELDTAGWLRAIDDGADLGVMQVSFTGGEPLLRADLPAMVARARERDLYVNVISSGIPDHPLPALRDAGVDHVQISVQHVDEQPADRIAGMHAHERKLVAARRVVELGMSLTINAVLHRHNIDAVPQLISLAESLGADRLELANTQWAGFALENRATLLPTADQVESARAAVAGARSNLEIAFVLADHFSPFPRACMDGWGRRYIHIAPDGAVLPCHSARSIPGLTFERVGDRSLTEIFAGSAFEAFRGEGWMQEPCASCDRRGIDFGGCRCQAVAHGLDPRATDPACTRSPDHRVLTQGDRRYLHRGAPSPRIA